jgi:hypothetical protein
MKASNKKIPVRQTVPMTKAEKKAQKREQTWHPIKSRKISSPDYPWEDNFISKDQV